MRRVNTPRAVGSALPTGQPCARGLAFGGVRVDVLGDAQLQLLKSVLPGPDMQVRSQWVAGIQSGQGCRTGMPSPPPTPPPHPPPTPNSRQHRPPLG